MIVKIRMLYVSVVYYQLVRQIQQKQMRPLKFIFKFHRVINYNINDKLLILLDFLFIYYLYV